VFAVLGGKPTTFKEPANKWGRRPQNHLAHIFTFSLPTTQ
jgi:hypothetical protein